MEGKNGHDIEFLKSKVEKICIPISRPFAKMDYEVITQDDVINQICKILSEYGIRGRYFNLDAILGTEQAFNAKKEWERIETKVLKDFYGEKKFYKIFAKPQKLEEIYQKSNELIVSKLELFLRAITRQFVFGNFSKDSKVFWFQIEAFSEIEDNHIGKTDYSKFENNEPIKRK